jgi:hypothetical protein
MLYATMAALMLAVVFGLWLSSLHLLQEKPPPHIGWVGALHGLVGASCVVLLWITLRRPVHGTVQSVGGFGWTAFWMLALTLLGGLTIASFYLRKQTPGPVLIALHATLGIGGAVMLAAWYSLPSSYGH